MILRTQSLYGVSCVVIMYKLIIAENLYNKYNNNKC